MTATPEATVCISTGGVQGTVMDVFLTFVDILAISQCRGVQPVTVTAGTLEASRPVGTFTALIFSAFININTVLGINQLIPSLTSTRVTAVSICTQLVAYVWLLTFVNIFTRSGTVFEPWDTITPEGPWCVEADLVVSRTWTAVTLVDVFLTRISPPAGTTDTPLNVVTLLGSSSTFTLCFTVFSVEARVAYCTTLAVVS